MSVLSNFPSNNVDKHASQHAANGSDPITPEMIGARSSNWLPSLTEIGGYNGSILRNNRWDNSDNIIDQRNGYIAIPGAPYFSDNTWGTKVGELSAPTVVYSKGEYATVDINGTTYYIPIYSEEIGTSFYRGYLEGQSINGWRIFNYSKQTFITIKDDALSLTFGTDSNDEFTQLLPSSYIKYMQGKPITMSVLTAEGDMYSATITCPSGTNATIKPLTTGLRFHVIANWGNTFFVGLLGEGIAKTFNIKAAFLDIGDTQKHFSKDANGNWIINDPPNDKGIELLKCITCNGDYSDPLANKTIATTDYALNKSGDNMSASLGFISKTAYNEDAWFSAGIQFVDKNGVRAGWFGNIGLPSTDSCDFWVANDKGGINLYVPVGGVTVNGHLILHEGNVYKTNVDISAGTPIAWRQYHVYE